MPNDPTPHWERFRAEALAIHPEWAPFFLGVLGGHGIYGEDDRRFFLEIPSEHPTIEDPLTVEISDPEAVGSIDVYWGDYFEHVFMPRGMPTEEAVRERFARVIHTVEEWMDESKVFGFWYEISSGRKAGWGRLDYPLTQEVLSRATERRQRIAYWSWRGSHDGEWSPSLPTAG